jgi:branched-chain amino acid transport system permease protein
MFSEDTILMLYEMSDVLIAGLSNGSVYALMAVGMTLVYGVTKAFNFAYGDFFNMGGYFAWMLIVGLGLEFGGYISVMIIVLPLLFGVGYGLEKFLIAPLRKRADWENRVMMLTLGLALFLTNLYMVLFGAKLKSLPPILDGILEVGEFVFSYQDIMIFCLSLGGILLFG